jgi:hypothetical protein
MSQDTLFCRKGLIYQPPPPPPRYIILSGDLHQYSYVIMFLEIKMWKTCMLWISCAVQDPPSLPPSPFLVHIKILPAIKNIEMDKPLENFCCWHCGTFCTWLTLTGERCYGMMHRLEWILGSAFLGEWLGRCMVKSVSQTLIRWFTLTHDHPAQIVMTKFCR